MKLPDRAKEIVRALYERHKDLARGDDEQRRTLTRMIAEQVRFELGPSWGHKSADPGRPPSKDAIAFQDGAVLWGFDLFNGQTREPWPDPEGLNITGQHFIDVSPGGDHLGAGPPPPPPPPDDDLALVRAELERLRVAVADLRPIIAGLDATVHILARDRDEMLAEMADLAARPFPSVTVSTSRVWGHSHQVKVP